MKRSFAVLICLVLAAAAARAQAVYAGSTQRFSLTAGAVASAFQPDYAGEGIAEASPNRLYGIGAYVDMRFSRWIQFEAEGHWLNYNQFLGINESSYMAGPRLPIHRFGRATPYAKALIGFGTGSFLTGNATTWAYGGGLDYRLTKHISIRAIDFEEQKWRTTPSLSPYGFSAGIGYKIF